MRMRFQGKIVKTIMIVMFFRSCGKVPKPGKFAVCNKYTNQQNVTRLQMKFGIHPALHKMADDY